jgi:hypothetical protein
MSVAGYCAIAGVSGIPSAAQLLALECKIVKHSCRESNGYCDFDDPVYSRSVEIDLDGRTWRFLTHVRSGKQRSTSGDVKSFGRDNVILDTSDSAGKAAVFISRINGLYFERGTGIVLERSISWSREGRCENTMK